MIITISGTPGSGKSTVAKIIAKKLNAKRIYVGGIRRELARKKGMTLEELNQYAKTHSETDVDVDKNAAAQARKLEKQGKVVIDEGYTQFHFVPNSIKIFIKADVDESARRIWKDLLQKKKKQERNEGKITSLKQMKQRVVGRIKEDTARYQQYYKINYCDESHYDLVLDSTSTSAEKIAQQAIQFIKENNKTYKAPAKKRSHGRNR